MRPIQIVDAIMGKGKSSWAIQHMNENTEEKFVYITPFLTEVERIKTSCLSREFHSPQQLGKGKLHEIHSLLARGKNIASTHALFKMYTDETIALIKQAGYTLILDEVIQTCEIVDEIKKDDIPTMLGMGMISVDDDGNITWLLEDYDGKYNDIKNMATNGDLTLVSGDKNNIIIWNFPADVFRAFDRSYVLTYKFHSQENRYYYDMKELPYEYNTVVKNNGRYELVKTERKKLRSFEDVGAIRSLITIVDKPKLNACGDATHSLSATWYTKKFAPDGGVGLSLKNALYNFYRNYAGSKSETFMWSTFKSAEHKLKGAGYTKRTLPWNARATNEWADVKFGAYLVNVFMNPIMSQYFRSKGVEIDEDGFATSEMLQWIWRSAIRKGEPITMYIPSSRMRNLLINYLNGEDL